MAVKEGTCRLPDVMPGTLLEMVRLSDHCREHDDAERALVFARAAHELLIDRDDATDALIGASHRRVGSQLLALDRYLEAAQEMKTACQLFARSNGKETLEYRLAYFGYTVALSRTVEPEMGARVLEEGVEQVEAVWGPGSEMSQLAREGLEAYKRGEGGGSREPVEG